MDNTKLIAEARKVKPHSKENCGDVIWALVSALEAAEAELTRRDTAAHGAAIRSAVWHVLEDRLEDDIDLDLNEPEESERFNALVDSVVDVVLAAAPVPLEAVKAETTSQWSIDRADAYPPEVMDEWKARRLRKAWHYPLIQREVTEWRPVKPEEADRV